jgi:hypothetical protein
MYPLTDQVRLATQYSENLVARLTGREPVTFDGKPTTFAKCFERIETVLKVLNEADKNVVNQRGDIVGTTKMGPEKTVEMSGAAYAHSVALPMSSSTLLPRMGFSERRGVPLGKRDYYVGFFPRQLAGGQ